ncbi:MAG: peptide deformylase [Magnetococcus sp. DMHC-6]
MAILPILTAPDNRLKKKALPVEQVDDEIRQILKDMRDTMYHASGVGLAAPQVGILKKLIVMDVEYNRDDQPRNPLFIVNPELIVAEGTIDWEEGCLSVPEQTAEVSRFARVVVRGLDQDGQLIEIEGSELKGVCLQHEMDHLEGTLFIDRISRLKRSIILKKLTKHKSEKT